MIGDYIPLDPTKFAVQGINYRRNINEIKKHFLNIWDLHKSTFYDYVSTFTKIYSKDIRDQSKIEYPWY